MYINPTVNLMGKDTYVYRHDYVYKDTRYENRSSIECKQRVKTEKIEGENLIDSLSLTGTRPHLPNSMKYIH